MIDFLLQDAFHITRMESLTKVKGLNFCLPKLIAEVFECFKCWDKFLDIAGSPLIISNNGASGDYPGCTDLAYQRAIDDGADIIDCSVQMSSDGVAFCLDSIDLNSGTNALTQFMTRSETVPELQSETGVFSPRLTWEEIQSLKRKLPKFLPFRSTYPCISNYNLLG